MDARKRICGGLGVGLEVLHVAAKGGAALHSRVFGLGEGLTQEIGSLEGWWESCAGVSGPLGLLGLGADATGVWAFGLGPGGPLACGVIWASGCEALVGSCLGPWARVSLGGPTRGVGLGNPQYFLSLHDGCWAAPRLMAFQPVGRLRS